MSNVIREDDDDQKDDELIITEEDPTKKQVEAQGEDDDGEDQDQEDERSAKAKDPEEDEREAIRERRRQEKQERKERREKAISRDKLELDFLRKRNDDLERRLTAQEQRTQQLGINSFDAQIAEAKKEIETADRVIAKAIEVGNGADAAQALKYRDEALAKVNQLTYAKQQAQQAPKATEGLDDLTAFYAKRFIENNSWYDPVGRNEESAIVLAIDKSLSQEGYDSRTEEYWEELERRAARRLPERFKDRDDDDDYREDTRKSAKKEERQPRGGPAMGSGKEHAPASTRKEIYISPERKEALIEAGVWDDPVLRARYAKRYAEYDKAQREQNRA